jgi:hypothetical protein
VCLDELGYLNLPDGAAELVFQVLAELRECGSLIVTTNPPFGEWTKVFPDARMAKAVVDRLTHGVHIIDTGTKSWRFRHGLTRKGSICPTPDRTARMRLSPLRFALRGLGSATTAASTSPIRHHPTKTSTNREVGHFKRSRCSQAKPSSSDGDAGSSSGTAYRAFWPDGSRSRPLPATPLFWLRAACTGHISRQPRSDHERRAGLPGGAKAMRSQARWRRDRRPADLCALASGPGVGPTDHPYGGCNAGASRPIWVVEVTRCPLQEFDDQLDTGWR